MAAVTIPIQNETTSRFYQNVPIITTDNFGNNITTFGRWTRPDWMMPINIASTDVLLFQVNQQFAGRPDLISQKFYGTPYYEWVIVMFNSPLNPLGFPVAGSVIKILSSKIVFSNT